MSSSTPIFTALFWANAAGTLNRTQANAAATAAFTYRIISSQTSFFCQNLAQVPAAWLNCPQSIGPIGRGERMEYLLLVTWFLGGNSTTSYQVAFASRQACDIALSDLRNDARRLGAFGDTVRTPAGAPTTGAPARNDGSPAPVLSAVCVNQR